MSELATLSRLEMVPCEEVRPANDVGEAPRSGVLPLPDGATAALVGRALEVRDPVGRLLVRYADGAAEIVASSGDLVLSAPHGRVVVRSDGISVEAREAAIEIGLVRTFARTLTTQADHIAVKAAKYELTATRLFERSRDAFREVADLAQTRVGRARTIAKTLFSVKAERTVLQSKEDTSIDGRKILLG